MVASQSAKPSDDENSKLLKPTSDHIAAIQNYRERHRASGFFNHLSAVSESVPALGWVTVVSFGAGGEPSRSFPYRSRLFLQSPTPAPYIKEMNDAGQFYTNRVLKDWKEK